MTIQIELTASPSLLEAVQLLQKALIGGPLASIPPIIAASEGKLIPSPEQNVPEEMGDTPGTLSIETLRAEAQKKSKEGSRDAVKALLTEFGAKNITTLDTKRYQDFYLRLKAL